MTAFKLALGLCLASALAPPLTAFADPPGDPTAATQDEQGLWHDKNGDPTYKVEADGTVDWNTFSGFRRYNAACIVCHGPDGAGSSYAPALANSLKTMGYADFFGTVVGGKKDLSNGNDLVMPAFGENKNVMCYINDIYVYLRARSTGTVGRGRPDKHGPKPAAFTAAEDKCMGPG